MDWAKWYASGLDPTGTGWLEAPLAVTWRECRLDWVNVTYFTAIHVGAALAPWFFTWSALLVCAVLVWVSASLGIGLAYHRMLTHQGFSMPRPLAYLFTVFGMLASEGGAISWVAMHRKHHAFSDRPGQDLHTPKDGFWWSHLGWVLCHLPVDRREMEQRYAPELWADPVHRVLNRLHVLPNVLVGLGLFAWGGHAFPRSARHGLKRFEVDLNWWAICALRAVGLVRDVQLLPKGHERFELAGRQDVAAQMA
jgi:sn-2 palmitoyl-lipid 9-desaturase